MKAEADFERDKDKEGSLSSHKRTSEALALEIFKHIPCIMQTIRQEMRINVYDLTIPQFRILARLESGATNHRDLAEWIGVSLPAISRMVNMLEERGLVLRDRQRKDRRYVHLTLTEQGLKLFRKCKSLGQKSLSIRFNNMSINEKESLIIAIRKLGGALAQEEGQ